MTVEQLQQYLVPITSREQALAYVRLLRLFFEEGDAMPGLPPATPERHGVLRSTMEEVLRAEGIDPSPRIGEDGGALLVTRLVVVRDDDKADAPPTYRLVRIHERMGKDGRYEVRIGKTIPTRADIERWIWSPL